MNYHYSKSVPLVQSAFSVFNAKGEWCGVICYSIGANNNISKPYNLTQGQVCELVRVALNGKQESTSKAVAISLKLLSKANPLVKLVVSYADEAQGHTGTIYQATNWHFTGDSFDSKIVIDGKAIHKKTVHSNYGTNNVSKLNERGYKAEYVADAAKHKYIYPLDKTLIPMCKALSKPYPKKETCGNSSTAERQANQPVDGVQIDLAAQRNNEIATNGAEEK